MLRPEPMSRVLLVGPRDSLDEVTEILYELKLVHLVDYKGEDEVFKIGKPFDKAARISEDLIKLRSITSILKVDKAKTPAEAEVSRDLRQSIATLELNIVEEDSSRKKTEALLSDLNLQITELEPFAELGLNLEMYRGYESLEVFVGRVTREIEGLEKVSPDHEIFQSENLVAIFVPKEKSDVTRDVLLRQGFSGLTIPKGTGDPQSVLAGLKEDRDKWQKRLVKINERLEKLRDRYAGFIVAAEKQLGVEIEKAEAPLRFATSDHTFVIDGWIPEARYDALQSKLRVIGSIHISKLEESPGEESPTLLRNAKPVKPFESFVHLFSTPASKELDPTIIFAVIFPIFFGFMIGDAGYGGVWLILGIIALRKLGKGGFRDLVFAVTLGGFFAFIFGLFLFGEAFGMPFIAPPPTTHDPNPMGWDRSLGISIPIASVFHKLENPVELILLSMLAAFVHLGCGFVFGFINEWRHKKKHAIAKLAWLIILLGLAILITARFARWPGFGQDVYNTLFGWIPQGGIVMEQMGFMSHNPIPFVSVGMLIGGAVTLVVTESVLAPIEITGLLANVVSYARLAGVAVAKAATATAFNTIVFTVAAPGGALIIIGLLLAFVFHMLLFFLGAVSAGIQAVRLNYVEFFLKFFKGNGTRFRPFGLEKTQEV